MPHKPPDGDLQAAIQQDLQAAIQQTIQQTAWARGVTLLDSDLAAFRDAVHTLPQIAALRADAEESGKRLDALIRVRHERDALRAKMRAVLHLADEMEAAAARIRAAAEQAHPDQAGA